jgi:ABC-2 type transport system permease protein
MNVSYTRFELLRTVRNRRFFIFSIAFPLVLYFLIAGANKNVHNLSNTGISAPLYFMVSLAAFGTMNAVLSSGARIATERSVGWTRQLRITPLSPRAYFRAKILTGYMMALLTIILLDLAGASLGVSLPAGRWVHMTALMLVGLVPLVVLGIALGHLLTSDSVGPAIGGLGALFAFLGGAWFPLGTHGFLYDLGQWLPSYWLVLASHVALGGQGWSAKGWIVIAIWTVVLSALAVWLYQRDTGRA